MAPKPLSRSRQPSLDNEEKEKPFPEEEEEESEAEHSSEEEKEENSDEEEEESSEDEVQQVKNGKKSIPVSQFDSKSTAPKNGAADPDSDPDSEGTPSDYKLQPIIAKPVKASAKRVRQRSDGGQNSVRSSKKSKIDEKKPASSNPGGGFAAIVRLWSNEDEETVLNGMIEFRKVKGVDPKADKGEFYDFVKGNLQAEFSRDQLRTKIVRLKKRFLNALKKAGDEEPVFSKPHEDRAFKLSKKIWGGVIWKSKAGDKNAAAKVGRKNAKKEAAKAESIGVDGQEAGKVENEGEGDFWTKYPFLGKSLATMSGNFPSFAMTEVSLQAVKRRLSTIGDAKAKALDDQWRQLCVEEADLHSKMLNLMSEQLGLAFDH